MDRNGIGIIMGDLIIERATLEESQMKGLAYTDYKVWKLGLADWSGLLQELSWDCNTIEAGMCWRLAHDGVNIIALFESDGETGSIFTLFEGTEQECLNEIIRLNLSDPEGTIV